MKPETRIAIDGRYIQDHFPGIGRYTFNLIDALARVAPDEQFVILYNPGLENSRYNVAALSRYPNIELARVDIPTLSLVEQYYLPRALQNLHAAIYHSPYYLKPYFARALSIVTIFDLIPLHFPALSPRRTRILFRWLVTLAARTATRVIVPSLSARQDLVSSLRLPEDKLVTVPLGIDARFTPQAPQSLDALRARYNLPVNYILYVGSNKPHKNLATLVKAWQPIESRVSLVIAGAWDARYATDIPSSAITYLRDVPDADLPTLYTGATAFVFPSLSEGFGLPPLEAMACGTPVICSNTSSLPQVAGNAALTINPYDVGELAHAIEQVLNDASLRDALRAKGLARAAQFSWERTARETLQVYQNVIHAS